MFYIVSNLNIITQYIVNLAGEPTTNPNTKICVGVDWIKLKVYLK